MGFLLPTEVLVSLESTSSEPDVDRIGRLGVRDATLGGVQGAFQLAVVVPTVLLRFGGV